MKRRTQAFTLVELLVVIGIIAVLIAMLLPALNRARQQAQTVQCSSNLRQIAIALISYSNDNKGKLIPDIIQYGTTGYPYGFFWANALVSGKYLRAPTGETTAYGATPCVPKTTGNSVFFCPSANSDYFGTTSTGKPDGSGGAEPWVAGGTYPRSDANGFAHFYHTNDPADKADDVATWYQLNCGVTSGGVPDAPFLWLQNQSDLTNIKLVRKMSQISKPSMMVMVLDGSSDNLVNSPAATDARLAGRHGPKLNSGKDGLCNMAFFDGHVAGIPTTPFTNAGSGHTQVWTADPQHAMFLLNQQ